MLALGVLLFCQPIAARAQPLRLLLDGAWAPHHAPYFLGIERGLFTQAGIDATLEPTRGSTAVAAMIGQRDFDLGQMTASGAAAAIARGVPMRMIAIYQPRTALAVVGIKGRIRLQGPRSLDGLRVGVTPGAIDGLAMTLFRRANALGTSTMTILPINARDKLAALISGRVDAVIADGLALRAALRAVDAQAEMLELADNGVPLQGLGFVASQAFLAGNADLTRRALGAIRRSFAAAAADPQAACQVTKLKVVLAESQVHCVEALKDFLARTTPPDSPAWGRQTPEAWGRMIEMLRATGEIQGTRPASTYYTNEFLP